MLAGAAIDGVVARGESPAPAAKLALKGGPKAVKVTPVRGLRWGEPERKQLDAMLQQKSLFYWKGPQTKLLIERFQKVCPLKYVQTCSSGTAALHIAVAACGIGLGDEVITSPITDIGTVIGVIYQQGVPVFADLGAGTYNLDVADVERRITPKTKAIIAVHSDGQSLRPGRPEGPGRSPQLGPDRGLLPGMGARSIAAGRSAPWAISPASRCRTPSTSPAATAAWWPPTTNVSGRCCKSSATREATASSAAASRRSPPTIA